MFRKLSKKLENWKVRERRHPLILRGARQVGKTYLVREFAKRNFSHYIELNFEQDGTLSSLFASKNPGTICELLLAKFSTPIEDGKTLVFLDELQAAESCVLESLRYFGEQRAGLHVIAAGSLLEFLLEPPDDGRVPRFPMPVGRIEYMYVPPMDFEEFLLALGKSGLVKWLQGYRLGDDVPDALDGELQDILRRYLAVGGMPAVVESYAKGDIAQAEREQQMLISTYHDDFPKYSARVPAERLRKVFSSVPTLLGGKLIYSRIDPGEKSNNLSSAFDLLRLARVVAKVRHVPANGIPVGNGADERTFKPLFLDVGLVGRILGLKLNDFLHEGDALLSNLGPVCEQFVGQHLLYAGEEYEEPAAYCWIRESRGSSAEIDYIVQSGTRIVPIEVKGGTTGSLKGLHVFLAEKKCDFAVRFNADKPSYLSDAHAKDALGRTCDYRFLSLPLYMICQLGRHIGDALTGLCPTVRPHEAL